MKLSKRLLAVAGMVTPGSVLADIGTDHAYIPIYLVENNIIPRAIAMDVNRGPLMRAQEHIRDHALEDSVETRLSDGLAALCPDEAQSIVIAGMGGALTVRILQEGEQLLLCSQDCPFTGEGSTGVQNASQRLTAAPELILQPQSEVPQVRAYLSRNGFHILQEDMVFEDGKYYPMMKVRHQSAARDTEDEPVPSAVSDTEDSPVPSAMQLAFGPELLKMRHPVLQRYLLRERAMQGRILEALGQGSAFHEKNALCANSDMDAKSTASAICKRMSEVQNYIRLIDGALKLYSD